MMVVSASKSRQSAIRILACITAAGDPEGASAWGEDIVSVLRSESRLQALDFWMRYPDYLANELLNEYEETGDPELLSEAVRIFDSREPELRHIPMARFLYGAFEPLDDALSILRHKDLVRRRKDGIPGHHVRDQFYLLTKLGHQAMLSLEAGGGELVWYLERARLVARVAKGKGGKALKDRQYLVEAYKSTDLRKPIAPIKEKVVARLAALKGMTV